MTAKSKLMNINDQGTRKVHDVKFAIKAILLLFFLLYQLLNKQIIAHEKKVCHLNNQLIVIFAKVIIYV